MIFKNSKSLPRRQAGETPASPAGGRNPKLGFTLIELIVGMGIFVVAVVGLSTLFVGVLRVQRQAFVESLVVDNARYAMDEMTRAIRVSDIEHIADNSPQVSIVLDKQPMVEDAFGCQNVPDCAVGYFYTSDKRVEERRGDGITLWSFDLAGDASVVRADSFQVTARGCAATDALGNPENVQPRVTLTLITSPRQASGAQPLNLQTTVSLRQVKDGCD